MTTETKKTKVSTRIFAILGLILLSAFLSQIKVVDPNAPAPVPVVASTPDIQPKPPAPVAATTCTNDWTKCKDNRELANDWSGNRDAAYACKLAANEFG